MKYFKPSKKSPVAKYACVHNASTPDYEGVGFSSLIKLSSGKYRFMFDGDMANVNYVVLLTTNEAAGSYLKFTVQSKGVNYVDINVYYASGLTAEPQALANREFNMVIIGETA